ncbi:MAG TPA: glycogen debranching enzyme GlgX, partial [Fibrobacteres bacterium]|nr:glycogen debranching enzyme GlgX [Fibrobacterota bacterium]
DPYARALHGTFRNPEGVLAGHLPGIEDGDLFLDHRPSHSFMPKCVVTQSRFDWQGDRPPAIPRERLKIYEMHVRGFTADPSSGVAHPGTFSGLIEKIPHLKSLGINAVELLPVHAKYSEDVLVNKGLSNYWGYNNAGFFGLETSYGTRSAPGCEIDEFKLMVRELHRAGIEVILDVVYNHTAEGTELGPTLSWRGLDNHSYYALTGPEDAPLRHYRNHAGCGNILDFGRSVVVRMALDSLRYFVEEFHVDGFRFDLATVLGRQNGNQFEASGPFFAAIAQDPVLRRVKLIAEPWDMEAYAVGRFPDGWMEWNGGFRDTLRRWVKGEAGTLSALRDKLEGSPELYEGHGREAWSSINFVTCHDGFTLRDLVTYEHKRNEANGESNWDGSSANFNWNCGHEGEGGGEAVEALRQRQARNLLLLNVLARGVPLLLGGDETLRTQSGNNNAYCQDNAVSWHDWNLTETQTGFLRFFREALAWKDDVGILNTWAFVPNRAWGRCWQGWDSNGKPWPAEHVSETRQAAFLLRPLAVHGKFSVQIESGEEGPWFYLILNTENEEKVFRLPALPPPSRWALAVDTAKSSPDDIQPVGHPKEIPFVDRYVTMPYSSVLLKTVRIG